MVHKHQVTALETGRTPEAIPPCQLTFKNVLQVSAGRIGQVLPVFQAIPCRALIVLKEGKERKTTQDAPHETVRGGRIQYRNSSDSSWLGQPMATTVSFANWSFICLCYLFQIVFENLLGEDGGMHGISGLPLGRSARLCARGNPNSILG